MNTKKSGNHSLAGAAACLIASAWGLAPTPLIAGESGLGACRALAGTFLTTVSDGEGVFSSRGLQTFTTDGIFLMSDSAQGGVPGIYDPFGSAQGAWKCLGAENGKLRISAVGLNFVLPGDGRTPSFGRVDYRAGLDTGSGILSGSATLRITSAKDLEGADPMDKPGPVVDQFHFVGRRVVAE